MIQKKQKVKIYLFLCCIYFSFSFYSIQIKAASATITIDSKTLEVEKGTEVIVTLSVEAEDLIGGFEAYLSYTSSILDFQSGGKYVSGDEGLLLISDLDNEAITKSKLYSMTFKAIDTGICKFSINDLPKVYAFEQGIEMSASSNNLEIVVESAKELSNNCNLVSLKISPGVLKPSFASSVTNYETSIADTTDELYISATAQEAEASVTMYGNQNLKTGENKVEITVKAPSGEQKKYTILVIKGEKAETTEEIQTTKEPGNKKTKKKKEKITDFSVKEKNGKIYLENFYQYQIVKLKDNSLIPDGYKETNLVLYGTTIKAYTLADNLDADFVLFYAKNKEGEKNFYQYDRIEKTIQRYQTKSNSVVKSNDIVTKVDNVTEYNKKIEQLSIIIAIIAGFMVIFAIGTITMYLKYKNALAGEDDLD